MNVISLLRKGLVALLCLLYGVAACAQGWTDDELRRANTAAGVKSMTVEEREVVKYINLARLYPQKFAEVEVADYYGEEKTGYRVRLSNDRLTLIAELMTMTPREPLTYSKAMQDEARCLVAEQRDNGEVGHERHKCKGTHGGECCGYGHVAGRAIALQLLIDDGVEGVGHRANLLNAGFGTIGVATDNHPTYDFGTVVDLQWGDGRASTELRYTKVEQLTQDERARYLAVMTRGVERDLVEPFPSGTPVVDVQFERERSTRSDGSFVQVKRETRLHADGRKQIIETTTTMGIDGSGDTKRRVWVE